MPTGSDLPVIHGKRQYHEEPRQHLGLSGRPGSRRGEPAACHSVDSKPASKPHKQACAWTRVTVPGGRAVATPENKHWGPRYHADPPVGRRQWDLGPNSQTRPGSSAGPRVAIPLSSSMCKLDTEGRLLERPTWRDSPEEARASPNGPRRSKPFPSQALG